MSHTVQALSAFPVTAERQHAPAAVARTAPELLVSTPIQVQTQTIAVVAVTSAVERMTPMPQISTVMLANVMPQTVIPAIVP